MAERAWVPAGSSGLDIPTDRADFDAFNDAFRAAFGAPYPSRATVLAQLIVPELKIEATCVAVRSR